MTRPDNTPDDAELHELIVAVQEDRLTSPQAERLNALLMASDTAVDTYIRRMAMHADLRWRMGGADRLHPPQAVAGDPDEAHEAGPTARDASQQTIFGSPALSDELEQDDYPSMVLPMTPPPPPRQWWLQMRRNVLAGAAAAIVIVAVTLGVLLRSSAATVATLTSSTNPTWTAGAARFERGETLREGATIDLAGGSISLRYPNGVELLLQGPARIDLASTGRIVMSRGRVNAKVPPPAHGFTVSTDFVEVIDLGTEFSVSVTPDAAVEVNVLEGKVEARPTPQAGGGSPVALIAGQKATVDAAGVDVETAAPPRPRSPAVPGVKPAAVTGGPSYPNQTSEPSNLLDDDPETFWAGHPGNSSWDLTFDFGQKSVIPFIRVEYVATRYIPRQALVSVSVDGTKWDTIGELPANDVATLALNRDARFVKIALVGKSTRRQPAVRSVTFPNAPGESQLAPATKQGPT